MPRDARACLWDVLEASDAIGNFVAGLDLLRHLESALVQSAVERKLREELTERGLHHLDLGVHG